MATKQNRSLTVESKLASLMKIDEHPLARHELWSRHTMSLFSYSGWRWISCDALLFWFGRGSTTQVNHTLGGFFLVMNTQP